MRLWTGPGSWLVARFPRLSRGRWAPSIGGGRSGRPSPGSECRGRWAMVKAAERAGRPARASVWLDGKARRGGGTRGGQPSGLDRDRITGATVRLLDAEGLARFSMRRLAAELNVTAMSVYWYVDTKDDLLELALDAAYGEMRLPGAEPDA